MTVEIPITRGLFALVDLSDSHLLDGPKWQAAPKRCAHGGFYAQRTIRLPNGKRTNLFMHRAIMVAGPDQIIDHINGNGLDNRRSNLRITDLSGNNVNRTNGYKPKSGFRGVYANRSRWRTLITVNGSSIHGGVFGTPEQAALRYDQLASEHFGAMAVLNFPLVRA